MSFCVFHCTDLDTIKYSEIFFPEKGRMHGKCHVQRKHRWFRAWIESETLGLAPALYNHAISP